MDVGGQEIVRELDIRGRWWTSMDDRAMYGMEEASGSIPDSSTR